MSAVLSVSNLHVGFSQGSNLLPLVSGVSFTVNEGQCVGILGESGSGKSMTCKAVLGLLDKNFAVHGSALFHGRELLHESREKLRKLRGAKICTVLQNPMSCFDPLFRIGEQMEETIVEHSQLRGTPLRQKCLEILNLMSIRSPSDVLRKYPHQLSGGMRQRIMIAMALACKPKILIADEPTTALDVTVQAQILRLMVELKEKTGTSIILITHDLGIVAQTADKVIVMYAGEAVESSDVKPIFKDPLHPYTIGLLRSLPKINEEQKVLYNIVGSVPSPKNYPTGCRFSPRCEKACEKCKTEKPPFYELASGRKVRCWLYSEEGGIKND